MTHGFEYRHNLLKAVKAFFFCRLLPLWKQASFHTLRFHALAHFLAESVQGGPGGDSEAGPWVLRQALASAGRVHYACLLPELNKSV